MKHPRPNAITVMPLMLIIVSGITWVDIKFRMARRIPTLSKLEMLSCATIWLVWQGPPVVSRVALMRLNVPCAFSSTVSIIVN
jgi:hypothetical protein